MIGDVTREKIKESLSSLVDQHFRQIAEVYHSQGEKTAVGFSVKIDGAKDNQAMLTCAISFVKTRITDKIIVYTDDEQMKIPGTE